MKSILYVFTLSVILTLLSGCADSNVPDSFSPSLSGHSLDISNNQMSFEAQGGVENATVHANNVAWRFTGLPVWLTVSPGSGLSTASVTFTATENLSGDTARTAIFYLESAEENWNYRTMISASQKAAGAYIRPALTTISFQGGGGSQTVKIASNVEWTATSSASWVHAEAATNGNAVTIEVEVNPSDTSRTAVVTLHSTNGVSSYIDIIQEPAGVTGSTETLTFEKEGGTKTVPIMADAEWNANTSDSWILVSPSSGAEGNHTLAITALESNTIDERLGNVYINIGGFSKLKIPVIQKGLYLDANPSSLSFSADTESKQIEINSNTDWCITSLPEWLTANKTNGINSQLITLTTQINTSLYKRSGQIKIEKEGLSLSTIINVQQEGASFSVDHSDLLFSDMASTQDIYISTVLMWTASTSAEWIHLSKTSGTGKSTLSISVDENTNENTRTGSVMIIAGDFSQKITITQQGKYFIIDAQETTFGSHGGTHQISFSTNEDWTATLSDGVSWLTLSETSGTGDAIIIATAKDNASMKSREGSIAIKPSNNQGVIVNVKQDGRYLTIDREKITFAASGGSSVVNVKTDGSFIVTTTNDWLSPITIQSKITIWALENEGGNRQGKVTVKMTGLNNGETYEKNVTVEQKGNDSDGHGYVNLGLPSGTKWATCNLGASSPNGKGYLYAWGESTHKTDFYPNNYVYSSSFSDAATVEWGENWHTPTKEQMDELVNKCEWVASYSGDNFIGCYVYGPNGKSIFLPACGSGGISYDTFSRYWTKTLSSTDDHKAYHLRMYGGGQIVIPHYRYFGAAIRPVYK